jgi:hypothetical protein
MESGQAAVLLGVVEQGVLFPKDETHFRCIHHAMSQSSMPSWLHTFASACLSGRCCSPGAASYLADSQRLTGCLVYPEGLPVQLDPLPIPSYSFHGAHMDSTTVHSCPSTPMNAGREQRRGGTVGRVWSLRGAQQGVARCTHAGPWLDSNLFVTLPTLEALAEEIDYAATCRPR